MATMSSGPLEINPLARLKEVYTKLAPPKTGVINSGDLVRVVQQLNPEAQTTPEAIIEHLAELVLSGAQEATPSDTFMLFRMAQAIGSAVESSARQTQIEALLTRLQPKFLEAREAIVQKETAEAKAREAERAATQAKMEAQASAQKAVQEKPMKAMEQLRTIFPTPNKTPGADVGEIDLGQIVKQYNTQNHTNFTAPKVVATLVGLMQQAGSQVGTADRPLMYQAARALWRSEYFKILTPDQRKAVNDARKLYATTVKEKIEYYVTQLFTNIRDSIVGTHGLTEEHQKELFHFLEDAERGFWQPDFQRGDEKAVFELVNQTVRNLNSTLQEYRKALAKGKPSPYKDIENLQTYFQSMVKKALTLSQEPPPLSPPEPEKRPVEKAVPQPQQPLFEESREERPIEDILSGKPRTPPPIGRFGIMEPPPKD